MIVSNDLELTEMVLNSTTTQLSSKIVNSYQVVLCFLGEIFVKNLPELQAKSLNEA